MVYNYIDYLWLSMSDELLNIISEIKTDIWSVGNNIELYEETNFSSRADAIDFLDFHVIDRIEGLLQKEENKPELVTLKQHAEQVKYKLEKIDTDLFKQLRGNIRAGIYTTSSFVGMINEYLPGYFDTDNQSENIGYDNLDNFINGLLSLQTIPEPTLAHEAEMVFYQKTPTRIIFEMSSLAQLKQDDVFFDIGAGLGQVAILMNLISGVVSKGIEYEPAYTDYATACASLLNLSNIEFINVDARKADYSGGNIFFMYTPFTGQLLQEVLDMLQIEASKRAIRIFTYGPCSTAIASQVWLNSVSGEPHDIYILCEFRSQINL
jgi:precorrin-6B methylase 2